MKISPIQNDFSGGMFSPIAQARSDLSRYKIGLALCENAIPTGQGPAVKRSGTRFLQFPPVNGPTRLIPFSYSNGDNFMIEFTDSWVRIYKNRTLILTGVSPYTAAELKDIKYTQSLNKLFLASGTRAPMILTRQTDLLWSLDAFPFYYPPLLSNGLDSRLTVITNPVLSALVTANTVGPNTTVISKFNTALNITGAIDNGSGFVRIFVNIVDSLANGSLVHISGVTGTTNANGDHFLTKSSALSYDLIGVAFNAAYIAGGSITPALVLAGDLGRSLAIRLGTTPWFYSYITVITDVHSVTITGNHPGAPVNVDTSFFKLGAFGDSIGWPNAIAFHQNRLYLAGPQSNTMYGSVVGDYTNFIPINPYLADGTANNNAVVTASDAITFTANSPTSNKIEWMISDEYGMIVGTNGGVFVLRSSSFGEPITATNASLVWVDTVGVAPFQAIRTEKSTIYVSSSLKKVFEIKYYYNIDGFKKTDLTEIAYDIAEEGFTSGPVMQDQPQGIIVFAKQSSIAMLTFNRSTDALQAGWSEHFIGGKYDSSLTPPRPIEVAVLFNPDTNSDDLWLAVNRTLDNDPLPLVTIEVMDKIFEEFNDAEFYNGVDCSFQYDQPILIDAITNGAITTIETNVAHGLANGNEVEFKGTFGLYDESKTSQLNGKRFAITVIDPTHFSIALDSTELSIYNGGGEIRKVVTQITGIIWMKNQEVAYYCDGDESKVGTTTVSNTGVATIPFGFVTAQIGFPFTYRIKGLRAEGGSQNGTSIGKYRRVNDIGVILNRSQSFKAGVNFDDMIPVSVKTNSDDNFQGEEKLFTGTIARTGLISDNAYDSQWCIEVSTPTPFQILAVMPQLNVEDFT